MTALVPLKRIASIRVSNVDKLTVEGQPLIRLCNYTDVYHRDEIRPDQEFMEASATNDQIGTFRLQTGDVLITKDSETADDIGVPAYVAGTAHDLVCGYHLAIVRPASARVVPRYLYWAMCSDAVRRQLTLAATGVTRFGLRSSEIGTTRLPLPEREQQAAIADFLDLETGRLNLLRRERGRYIDLLRERMLVSANERIRRLAVRHQVEPLWTAVSEIDNRLGRRPVPELLAVSIHRGVVRRSAITDDPPRADDFSTYKACRGGDIVLNRMRAFQGGVGVAPEPGIVSPDYTVLRPRSHVAPEYLHHLVRSHWFVSEMTARLRGIGAVEQGNVRTPRINWSDLRSIAIPIPPLGLQLEVARDLATEAGDTERFAAAVNRQMALLDEHRQAIITAAVTGQIDVASAVA